MPIQYTVTYICENLLLFKNWSAYPVVQNVQFNDPLVNWFDIRFLVCDLRTFFDIILCDFVGIERGYTENRPTHRILFSLTSQDLYHVTCCSSLWRGGGACIPHGQYWLSKSCNFYTAGRCRSLGFVYSRVASICINKVGQPKHCLRRLLPSHRHI
jgi:hypothetical protein